MIRDGLFELRNDVVGEPRLDGEDTRALTAALIAARDQARIVALARTANTLAEGRSRLSDGGGSG